MLKPAENIGNRTAWLCLCGFGRECMVKMCRLRGEHTGSCGCKGLGGKAGVDLPGLTYVDGTCVEMLRAKTV